MTRRTNRINQCRALLHQLGDFTHLLREIQEKFTAKLPGDAVEYLTLEYFPIFLLKLRLISHIEYGLSSSCHGEDGVLPAAWWGAYWRVQPLGLRNAFARSLPLALFFAMHSWTKTVKKLHAFKACSTPRREQASFPDCPGSRDPLSASSERLRNVGRSNAVQLFAKQAYASGSPCPMSAVIVSSYRVPFLSGGFAARRLFVSPR